MTYSFDWFCADAGRMLWAAERLEMAKCLSGLTGAHALQIGPAAETQSAIEALPYQGRWHYQPGGNNNNPWCGDSIISLPLQDQTVDLVVLRHCLDLQQPAAPLIDEVARVLVPGGNLLVCALNPSSWLGIGTGRRRNLPLMPAHLIKTNTQRAGLNTERCISLGLGGLGLASSGKTLPGALTMIGNINLVYCRKQRLSGEIRRLKFRFPRRSPTVSANPGVYSNTGT